VDHIGCRLSNYKSLLWIYTYFCIIGVDEYDGLADWKRQCQGGIHHYAYGSSLDKVQVWSSPIGLPISIVVGG